VQAVFFSSDMSSKEVGLRLRQARLDQGLSIEDASKDTVIRRRFLEALEDGDFGKLPSPVQVRGFLRGYAQFLGLDSAELFSLLEGRSEQLAEEAAKEEENDKVEEREGQREERAEEPGIKAEPEGLNGPFVEIGNALRERRKLLDLSYEDIEGRIRISDEHLARLERGDFDLFPSPTQARGMLQNYANFLGLESDTLLLQYAEAIQTRFQVQQEKEEITQERKPNVIQQIKLPPWLRRILSRENLAISLIALALGGLFIWGVGRIVATSSELDSVPTAPPLGDLLLASPTATITTSTAEAASADVPSLVEATSEDALQITVEVANPLNVEIQLVPNQRVWVRVTADGEIVAEGRLVPGQNYRYSANNEVIIFTGNASAIRVFLNGSDLGVLGIEGEVVNLLFSAEGLATPTPSATPLSTATPTVGPNAEVETTTPIPSATVDAGDGEQ
jgi:cytoskeletal protein RodZ